MINHTDINLVIGGGSDKNWGKDKLAPDISDISIQSLHLR
jgi:hypothetical protein